MSIITVGLKCDSRDLLNYTRNNKKGDARSVPYKVLGLRKCVKKARGERKKYADNDFVIYNK